MGNSTCPSRRKTCFYRVSLSSLLISYYELDINLKWEGQREKLICPSRRKTCFSRVSSSSVLIIYYKMDVNVLPIFDWQTVIRRPIYVLQGGKHASTESLYPGYWLFIRKWLWLCHRDLTGRPRLANRHAQTRHGILVEVLLYVHRNRRLIRVGSPGRPPRLSHGSWARHGILRLPVLFDVKSFEWFPASQRGQTHHTSASEKA